VANATSGGEDNNYQTTTTRQTYRFTPVVELRSTDFFSSPTLTWLLGKSVLTGLYEKNTVIASTYQFAEFATTPGLRHEQLDQRQRGQHRSSNRSFEWTSTSGRAC
jgi:hypothetical protein